MSLTQDGSFNDKVSFIWSVADLLRGDYRNHEYGQVILPLVVIRRLDCVLAETKPKVLARAKALAGKVDNPEKALCSVAKQQFYNLSPLDFTKLTADPEHIATNLKKYIGGFSPGAADVIAKFRFTDQIKRLDDADLLYKVVAKFAEIDLHPDSVDSTEMGYIYEELIRRFSEQANETAGEHFTPREVIRLMVNLLFVEDDDTLDEPGIVKTLFDPACGTGGMLAVAEEHLAELNPKATLKVFGQELNDESYAICRSDMMLKGQDATQIKAGNSFSADGFKDETFHYLLANPPFGVEWKKVEKAVRDEAKGHGFDGRFGAGLPRINDGSFLFLQHMISKMKTPAQGGSRIGIVFNGSPLFTGAAGSGESEIRRWIIENDWLEGVVALPDQLFYNTGISTYVWIVTNRKATNRQGKVLLLDGRASWTKMRKSLGDKRKQISPEQIAELVSLYGDSAHGIDDERVKVLPNEAFGFQRVAVERPLRLRWEVSEGTIAAVMATKVASKLEDETQAVLEETLRRHLGASAATAAELGAVLAPTARMVWSERDWTVESDDPDDLATSLWIENPEAKVILTALAVRDDEAPIVAKRNGQPEPDPDRRDSENVPLPTGTPAWDQHDEGAAKRLADPEHRAAVDAYLEAEVLPWVPDAWVDWTKTKIGYEIPLTRHFYKYVPPRPLAEIDAEIKQIEAEIQALLVEVTE